MAISQREEVLTHLKKGLPITSWEAIHEFRATRLSAIIFDLRQAGYNPIGALFLVELDFLNAKLDVPHESVVHYEE